MGDFNENLRASGLRALRTALRIQLAPQDVVRFMRRGMARTGLEMADLGCLGRSGEVLQNCPRSA